jgi:hypothetical protein
LHALCLLFQDRRYPLWAVLVAAGWAQALINFVFWVHFLTPPHAVRPFHLEVALILIVVTSAVGCATGYILGVLWNWIHRQKPT